VSAEIDWMVFPSSISRRIRSAFSHEETFKRLAPIDAIEHPLDPHGARCASSLMKRSVCGQDFFVAAVQCRHKLRSRPKCRTPMTRGETENSNLSAQDAMVSRAGLEPATTGLKEKCSQGAPASAG